MKEFIHNLLAYVDSPDALVSGLSQIGALLGICLGVLLIAGLSYLVTGPIFLRIVKALAAKSKTNLDDLLVEERFFRRFAYIIPVIVLYLISYLAFANNPLLQQGFEKLSLSLLIVVIMMVVDSFFNVVIKIYQKTRFAKSHPINSYVQLLRILLYICAAILILGTVVNKSPFVIFSGLGALTAVILLVFKDSILGFVASVQMANYDMLRVGDWVEIPKFGADGDVSEVNLTTVKIRNFDNTITTVPTYRLISDSFKNWRGMSESGGRRIKRSIYVDFGTVKFCSDELLSKFKKIELISDYVENKMSEVEGHNQSSSFNKDVGANLRRMTNIGTFRQYIENYLRSHSEINQNLTLLVRQLSPTKNGLPLEIYCFSQDKRWANYEKIQADIFDHIIAVAEEFDLGIYQAPSGTDFTRVFAKEKE